MYGYLDLNCAKTIGMGFKHGAGYEDLVVKGAPLLSVRKLKAALTANIPTEMAMKLMKAWNARGYRMDVVLYGKYKRSPYVDPHEEEAVAFKDLPDRFPSVRSRDFRRDEYKDYDKLYAMYLLDNMRRHTVALDASTGNLLESKRARPPWVTGPLRRRRRKTLRGQQDVAEVTFVERHSFSTMPLFAITSPSRWRSFAMKAANARRDRPPARRRSRARAPSRRAGPSTLTISSLKRRDDVGRRARGHHDAPRLRDLVARHRVGDRRQVGKARVALGAGAWRSRGRARRSCARRRRSAR